MMVSSLGQSQFILNRQKFNHVQMTKTMEKLSSGLRINRASDSPSGLRISQNMQAKIRNISRTMMNTQDNIAAIHVADGALSTMNSVVHRMREIAVQGANETLNDADRSALQMELDQLTETLNDVSNDTEYNGIKLLDGSFGVEDMRLEALGFKEGVASVMTSDSASKLISVVKSANAHISSQRSYLGARERVEEYLCKKYQTMLENLMRSESMITGADMARQTIELTKSQITSEAANAMLVHTKQDAYNVLELLR